MRENTIKFNEAIVNMLYPSPPQPQPQPQPSPPPLEEQELQPAEAFVKGSASDVISGTLDDDENDSSSGEEERNFEREKLTRAQRKNIRKKKLKEEASRRGKLIGPLLPLSPTTTSGQVAEDAPPVRSNASEKGDEPTSAGSKKLKRRRMAKRVAKEKRIASTLENCNQSSISSSAVNQKETHM